MRAGRAACACLLALSALSACGPRRLTLPSGDGEPFPAYLDAAREATAACRGVRSLSVELGISGRAGGVKLRGRVAAGLAAPSAIRLEGVAPFGPPAFILAADGPAATLLLPRDNRVVTGEPPAAILDALVGLDLGPADLLAILSGCVVPDPQPMGGRLFAGGWARLDVAGDAVVYLHRHEGERWRIRAGVRPRLRVEYDESSGQSHAPLAVRVVVADGGPDATDLRLRLSGLETNVPLGPEVFRVKVPAGAVPLALAELRDAGPMGERR